MSFAKFHDALCEGEKLALSRATRFVYMELCLKARRKTGEIILPPGKSLVSQVHAVIGGDRREIARAMPALMAVMAAGEEPMVRIETDPSWAELGLKSGSSRTVLVICSYRTWNNVDHSTARVQAFRAKKKALDTVEPESETRFTPLLKRNETVLEKRREEKKIPLSDDFVISERAADVPPPVAEPSGVRAVEQPSQLSLSADPEPKVPARARKRVVDAPSSPSRAVAHTAIRDALAAAAASRGRTVVIDYPKTGKLSNRLMAMTVDGAPLGLDGVLRLIRNAVTYQSWVDGGCDLGFIASRPSQYSVPYGPTLASTTPALVPFNRATLL